MSDAMTQALEWLKAEDLCEAPRTVQSLAALLTETRTKALQDAWQAIEDVDDGEAPEYRIAQEAVNALKAEGGEI